MLTEPDQHKDLERRMEVERAIRDDRQHWWVYSPESLPDFRQGFSREYVELGDGFTFMVEGGKWQRLGMELPDGTFRNFFQTVRFSDFQDRRGTVVTITAEDAASIIRARYADRGVVVLPEHAYRDKQKRAEAERIAKERNLEFRKQAVAEFEERCEEARQLGLKLPKASPWLKESYVMLNMTDPTSFEATVALRNPGSNTAREIAGQLEGVLAPLVQAVDGLARMVADLRGTYNKKTRHDKGVVGLVREGADDDRELAGEVSFGDVA